MPLTVHHLQVSQSERIPWLCEELSIPYELKNYARAPILAPPEYKALHPSGSAPIITDGALTLAESGACVEYISHKYGGGRFFLPPTHVDYADFLYWWHWSNGTFQAAVSKAMLLKAAGAPEDGFGGKYAKSKLEGALKQLDDRVKDNEWLAGKEFTVADVMVGFSLTTERHIFPYSLKDYPNVLKYLERIGKREAYQRAMAKSDPGLELLLGAEPPAKTLT